MGPTVAFWGLNSGLGLARDVVVITALCNSDQAAAGGFAGPLLLPRLGDRSW